MRFSHLCALMVAAVSAAPIPGGADNVNTAENQVTGKVNGAAVATGSSGVGQVLRKTKRKLVSRLVRPKRTVTNRPRYPDSDRITLRGNQEDVHSDPPVGIEMDARSVLSQGDAVSVDAEAGSVAVNVSVGSESPD